MQRPEELLQLDMPKNPKTARRLLAYLLRATDRRMSPERLGRDRYNSRSGEIEDMLLPCVRAANTCLGFYHNFCARFDVSASGGDSEWGPIEAWFPEGRMRWDQVLGAIEYQDLRLVVHEAPEFLATFATCRDEIAGEDDQFEQFPDPTRQTGYKPKLPEHLIQPKCYRTIWTLTSPLHHGADEKHGNVQLFRTKRSHDPLTGTATYVPFVAGNAVRGVLRDIMMGDWLHKHGLKATDIPPFRAHSLLAGGNVDKGSDGAKVNNAVRSKIRRLCPPWDLFAGCIEQQIMQGRARIGDATLICRENAWKTYEAVNPGVSLTEWAASLPEACTMTSLRLGTRHKHADIPESDGIQMLWNTEVLTEGYQMLHTLKVWCLDGVAPVTASCLSHLLMRFREMGDVAAGAAHGFGSIAFDPYVPGPGAVALPGPDQYLGFVESNKEEAIEWLMSPRAQPEESTTKRSTKKNGRSTAGTPVNP